MRFLNIMSYDAEMVLNVRADCIAGWETIRDHSSEDDYALIHLISGQTVRIKGDLDEGLNAAFHEECTGLNDVISRSPEFLREMDAFEVAREKAGGVQAYTPTEAAFAKLRAQRAAAVPKE